MYNCVTLIVFILLYIIISNVYFNSFMNCYLLLYVIVPLRDSVLFCSVLFGFFISFPSLFFFILSILFFFFLDHQRNIRAARTGAEGMVSHEP